MLPEIDEKIACITLDLEEDWTIPGDRDNNPTFEYLDEYVAIVDEFDIPISVFPVGITIERYPSVVERLRSALDAEFHLHSYQHDMSKSYNFRTEIRRGKEAFAEHFGTEPSGYRAPQGKIEPEEQAVLEEMGFEFDASIFPSYRPGVYNNLRSPLVPYVPRTTDNLLEMPFAAVPYLRIPIAQNYLKLLGDPYLYLLKHVPLKNLIVFDSHLQDFWHTKFHEHLPNPKRTLMTRNIDRAVDLFRTFMRTLRERDYSFRTISAAYDVVMTS